MPKASSAENNEVDVHPAPDPLPSRDSFAKEMEKTTVGEMGTVGREKLQTATTIQPNRVDEDSHEETRTEETTVSSKGRF